MITKDFDLDDVFLMSEIIDKMDLQVDIDKYMNKVKSKEKTEAEIDEEEIGKEMFLKIGIDLAIKFIKRIHKAKKEVKRLIANLTSKTMEEVSKMGIKDIKNFFIELSQQEDFKDFLSQAGVLDEN